MNWILIEFPSGEETNVSVVIVRPSEGAISSVSADSTNRWNDARPAMAFSVLAAAMSCSRSATSLPPRTGILPKMAFSRGSMRGSSESFDMY